MTPRLQELLTLVGRLDDASGSDTPRDRFRAFITEQVDTLQGVGALLEQCQESLGEQQARARQDLVVLLGRYLGFEITFGRYQPQAGGVRVDGLWRARHRARFVVDVRSEQTTDADLDGLARTVAALSAAARESDEVWRGLCVTTPFYPATRRLEQILTGRAPGDVHVVSLQSLLWLTEQTAAGRLSHDEAVRVLTSGPGSDFFVDLARRLSTQAAATTGPEAPRLSIVERADRDPEPAFWLAALREDETSTPEQFLESVIAHRQVLGISQTGPFRRPARQGDWVCFLIAGSIVGHAQLDGLIPNASSVIREARRFSAVFKLKNVSIYEAPRHVAGDSVALRIAGQAPAGSGCALVASISRHDYDTLTDRSLDARSARS